MLPAPCHEQLLLLARHIEPVPIKHIESHARHEAFDFVPGLCSATLKIDCRPARPVLR